MIDHSQHSHPATPSARQKCHREAERWSRDWTDEEPDTLTIQVQESADGSGPFIVFTCSSTWLDANTVEDEIIPWLRECVGETRRRESVLY